jgi:CheY-like chemotaxis protein
LSVPARILVVEDNAANLELMRYLLAAYGQVVTVARNGRAGLEAARTDCFDLVLADVLMPEIDGYELARRLRADPRYRAAPLVAVTALAMVGDEQKVLGAGFDGYISKPIDPEQFIELVDGYLPPPLRSRPRPEGQQQR